MLRLFILQFFAGCACFSFDLFCFLFALIVRLCRFILHDRLNDIFLHFGILDPFMIDTLQDTGKSCADLVNIVEGKRAFAQLSILEFTSDQALNVLINRLRCRILHGTDRRFNAISHHDNGCFPGTRLWSGIAEFIDIHMVAV